MRKNNFTIGGLCSGVGGIELGFRQAGFEIAWANDMDKNCMITYQAIIGENHYINKKPQKISEIIKSNLLPDPVSVIAAGFPCQAFSIAGERKGFEDVRGTVIYDIINLISKYKITDSPKVLFLENVKNFRTHNNGHTYQTIVRILNELNYSVYTKVLNSCEYSYLPQNRERTYMICFYGEGDWNSLGVEDIPDDIADYEILNLQDSFPKTVNFHFNFPTKNRFPASLKNKELRNNLFDDKVDERYYYNGKYEKMLRAAFPHPKEYTGYQIRRVYPRENKNNLIPTLTANMGTGGHNVPLIYQKKFDLWRKLTPMECFRIQGYGNYASQLPNSNQISNGQLYKQAGNSVTIDVIKKLATSIKIALTI